MLLFCLSGLNAQNYQDTIVQEIDSLELQKRDSVLLKRINPEDMFRNKKIAKIDSSDFDIKEIAKQLKAAHSDYRRWRFGVNGGIEVIIAPEPADISETLLKYKKTLKSGLRLGAGAVFFLSPNIGMGINYSTYSASNKVNHISYEINGNKFAGERQDDIYIHFVGPVLSIRSIPIHNKLYTSCEFSLGYFTYSNDLVINDVRHNFKENNFGFATSVGADYLFMKNISLGISLNITAASINNAEILSGNSVENISRISLVMSLKTYR
jgi:opacity protein-like surface antigen